MLSPNTLLQNRYLVIRHLSRGGMGAVYLVKHQRLGKTFALKETFFSDDDQLRKAFEREAQLLANLDHPALPKVTDHFTEGESQYLVMEYIPGEDLGAQLLASGKPFPAEQVLEWADQLLDALDYLHSNDPPIIHRDIKPSNLKLNQRGRIILLDFGLAKGETTEMSRMSRSVFGYTPNYAPLEQVLSEGTDARSDLYSLAATLYHMMTGEIPPRVTTRIAAVADGQPDLLRPANEVNPEIPAAVAAVLQQAMARNRNQRPESAAAMCEALRIGRQASLVEIVLASPVAREEKLTTLPLPEASTDSQAKSTPSLHVPSPTVKATDPEPKGLESQPSALPTQRAISPISPVEQALTLPSTNERIKRRGKLWLGIAAFILIIGLVVGVSSLISRLKNNLTAKQSEIERTPGTIDVSGTSRAPIDEIRHIVHRDVAQTGIRGADLDAISRDLKSIAWVREAVVSRVPQDSLLVQVTEREPRAIVRTAAGKFLWVDDEAVTLGAASPSDQIFIRGWDESGTDAARALNRERVQKFLEMTNDWEAKGISRRVSEVNLNDLNDVRAQLAGNDSKVEIQLGNEDFGNRLKFALDEFDRQRNTPIGPYILHINVAQGIEKGNHVTIGVSPDAPKFGISGKDNERAREKEGDKKDKALPEAKTKTESRPRRTG